MRDGPSRVVSIVGLLGLLAVAPAARADGPGPRMRASLVTVVPQGTASVVVFNKGSDAGVTTSDWVRHPRGVCRPSEVYALRAKCVMPVTSRDIGTIRDVEIWSDADVSPARLAEWTRPRPPEPEAPTAPPRWRRAPAPRLVVYRRLEDVRYTHACLGFRPDGAAAYVLTGGTRIARAEEAPLVLLRLAADGATSRIAIAEPGASAEAATRALDAIRRREKLLACHEAIQERLPAPVPADKVSTSWPALASHGETDQVFLWVDGRHLNAARDAPTLAPRALMPLVLDGPDGDETRPERLGKVFYVPGAALHVVELHGWGGARWVGVSVAP